MKKTPVLTGGCRVLPKLSHQTLLTMRLTILLLTVALIQVHARSYSQKVTLSGNNIPLHKMFKMVEQQTGYSFFYNNADIRGKATGVVNYRNTPLKALLGDALKGQQLSYSIKGKTIFIAPAYFPALTPAAPFQAEEVQSVITGTVTDSTGKPMSGVSVQLKGTKHGTITNDVGEFSLEISDAASAILIFRFVGYEVKEVPLDGRTKLHVQLVAEQHAMDDIVVTALGVRREERSLGYSVQRVKGAEFQTVKGVDIGTSLTGQVSGLVIKNSTEFDATPTIELRGESALLVIDGVPYGNVTLRDIPTDNIESIDVLKGPTASALYGARGANGAIMITTKSGKGEGISVDFNSNTMVTLGYLAIPKVQTSYGHGEDGEIATDYVWGPKLDNGDSAVQWNPIDKKKEMMPLVSIGKNNLRNFMNMGVINNTNVSVTQSGKNGFFRAGFNYIYNKGEFPNQHLNIGNFTLDGKINAGKKFSLEGHMGFRRSATPQTWGSGYGDQGYLYQILMWTGPDYDIRQYKDYWVTPNVKQNWLYDAWYDNPYLIAYQKLVGSEQNKLNASAIANYHFNDHLKLMLRSGYDYYKYETTVQSPAGINSTRGDAVGGFSWNFGGKGFFGMGEQWGFSTNNDLILTYNQNFGKLSVDVLGGGSVYYYVDRELGAKTVNGLQLPGWYSLANAIPSTTAGVNSIANNFSTSKKQVNSLYAKASFGWNKLAYIDITGRNDWSSTQSADHRSYFYPSVSGSLILSEFIHLPSFVDMWKVRSSWTIDKDMAGVYDNNRAYSIGLSWGLTSASYPSNLLPANLLPSSSRSWEFGTAAFLFKNRFHFDVAYFSKYYYNQQESLTISSASGFGTTLVNSQATYARRGMEVTVDGDIIRNSGFRWNSTINWSYNHRYWVHYDPVYSPDDLWHKKKGERLDDYLINDWERDPQGNVINVNGFPVQSDYQKKIGYGDPDFSFGFINNFTIGNFLIGINIDGRIGGIMYDYIWDKMFDTGANPETDTKWRYDQVVKGLTNYVGAGVKVVSGDVAYDKYGRITSDTRKYAANDVPVGYQEYEQWISGGGNHGYMNESFVKLREVSVGYSIPAKLLSRKGVIKNATVSLTAQNVLLLTGFKFSDPDRDTENLNSPSQRMVGFNIKLGF